MCTPFDNLLQISHFSYTNPNYWQTANYFSSPDALLNGVATGDLCTDNSRVLTENRFRSAGVGDESSTISKNGIFWQEDNLVKRCDLLSCSSGQWWLGRVGNLEV
jgi:hypothetical protein